MRYADHLSIIEAWPSLTDFAEDIGVSYNTAKHIRRRGRIPADYWTRLVEASKRRGIAEVDLETLAGLYAPQVAGQQPAELAS